MKKLSVLLYIGSLLCAVFTILNISFTFDVSFWAWVIGALATAVITYIAVLRFIKKQDIALLATIRKLYEYLPFIMLAVFVFRRSGEHGTSFAFDLISVILWLAISITTILVLYFSGHKRTYIHDAVATYRQLHPQAPLSKIKKVIKEIFEWIDAFIQAAFIVSLMNIFIIQLYEIPSESMVSEFLVGDKVIVFKTASGPRFPLSDIGIPQMRSYERGDIVVFRNPHYGQDRNTEVRTFLAQLVYMLTFTGVNLNVDESGQAKADPLVKRVVATGGEQLVMIDGILYSRTANNPVFQPISQDEQWANWNLNTLSDDIKKHVLYIPFTQADYDAMIDFEKERAELSLDEVALQAQDMTAQFSRLRERFSAVSTSNKTTEQIEHLISVRERSAYALFAANDTITRRLLTTDGGLQWFEGFMTDWITHRPSASHIANDPYTELLFKLNVMIKHTMGNLIIRNAELFAEGATTLQLQQDVERKNLINQAERILFYLQINSLRNMNVFPPNNQDGSPVFIPHNSFFMMGDNRFNSLDMRHSYTYRTEALTTADPYTAYYETNISPQYIPARSILGTTIFRFWPFNRIGVIK